MKQRLSSSRLMLCLVYAMLISTWVFHTTLSSYHTKVQGTSVATAASFGLELTAGDITVDGGQQTFLLMITNTGEVATNYVLTFDVSEGLVVEYLEDSDGTSEGAYVTYDPHSPPGRTLFLSDTNHIWGIRVSQSDPAQAVENPSITITATAVQVAPV